MDIICQTDNDQHEQNKEVEYLTSDDWHENNNNAIDKFGPSVDDFSINNNLISTSSQYKQDISSSKLLTLKEDLIQQQLQKLTQLIIKQEDRIQRQQSQIRQLQERQAIYDRTFILLTSSASNITPDALKFIERDKDITGVYLTDNAWTNEYINIYGKKQDNKVCF